MAMEESPCLTARRTRVTLQDVQRAPVKTGKVLPASCGVILFSILLLNPMGLLVILLLLAAYFSGLGRMVFKKGVFEIWQSSDLNLS